MDQLSQGLVDLVDHEGGQTERSLVDQDELRLGDVGPGQGQHLLFATREAPGGLASWLPRTGNIRYLGEGWLTVRPDRQVLVNRQGRKDPPAFRQVAHAARTNCAAVARSSPAGELDPARARLDKPGGGLEKGGLPGPVGPQEGDHLAVPDVEVDVAQYDRLAVTGGDGVR